MSEDTTSLTPNPLFARKGEAAPAPAVGYVGISDLRGKLDRRQAQRSYDGGEQRHSVLDEIVGEAAPAPVGAGGSLATLIHRRGGPRPQAPGSRTSAPEAAPPPQAKAPQRPVSKAPAARQASEPAAASPAPAQAKAAKPGRKRKRPRRQLTVRLPVAQFARFSALAKQGGHTYQDILATATDVYLEQSADEGAKKKGQAKAAKAGRRRAKSKG